MIDKEAMSDSSPGVDLDTGQKTADMGEQTPKEFTFMYPQPVGEAVKEDSVKPRITDNNLKEVSDGWVALNDNLKIFL
jgi:hypothetical protein